MQKRQTNGEALRRMQDPEIALSLVLWLSERMDMEPATTWSIWADMLLWFALPYEPAPCPSWMQGDEDGRG